MLEAGTEGNYKDEHPWLIAKELFEHAGSINQVLPIMFASKDPDRESEFSHWSTISHISVVELHRGKWESRVQFEQLEEFNPIWSNIDSVILQFGALCQSSFRVLEPKFMRPDSEGAK